MEGVGFRHGPGDPRSRCLRRWHRLRALCRRLLSEAGGIPARGLARWSGSAWSAVGGLDVSVGRLAVYDDGSGAQLYLIAYFPVPGGGASEARLLRWDGNSTTQVATFDASVHALQVYDDGSGPALYVGGQFTLVNGAALAALARWDGTSWSPVGGGVEPSVGGLAVHTDSAGSRLIVSGPTSAGGPIAAGGVAIASLAAWDGTAWSALPAFPVHVEGLGHALLSFDDGAGPALFVGKGEEGVGGRDLQGVLRLQDGAWTVLNPAAPSAPETVGVAHVVRALAKLEGSGGPILYALGDISIPGIGTRRTIAEWTGTEWRAAARPARGIAAEVFALAEIDDGTGPALTAGGLVYLGPPRGYDNIVRWDGSAWKTLGQGLAGLAVYTVAEYDDGSGSALYAGGPVYSRENPEAVNLLRWDGTAWSGVGGGVDTGGVNDYVSTLLVYDDGSGSKLIAAGPFTSAGGLAVNHIASWDGTSWSAMGNGLEGPVGRLIAHDDGSGPALFASWSEWTHGPEEETIRGGFSKWDGSTWTSIEALPTGAGGALAVHDAGRGPELYASILLKDLQGEWFSLVRRWDGATWTPVGSRFNGWIHVLGVHDEGRGPALYAGGIFRGVGASEAAGIARWDPAASTWKPLQGDFSEVLEQHAISFLSHDDGSGPALLVGGLFCRVGGVVASGIAKYTCDPLLFADDFERGDLRRWTIPSL